MKELENIIIKSLLIKYLNHEFNHYGCSGVGFRFLKKYYCGLLKHNFNARAFDHFVFPFSTRAPMQLCEWLACYFVFHIEILTVSKVNQPSIKSDISKQANQVEKVESMLNQAV